MMFLGIHGKRASETGSALVYILIAIALLAALTASFMKPSSQQTTAQGSFNAVTEIKAQTEFIRSSIQECVLNYPAGDRGQSPFTTHPGLQGTSNTPYPINPSSTYYDNVVAPAANDNVEFIRCPGNPGNVKDHSSIFGGTSGKFLPPAPDLFGPWEYYSGVDGVFFFNSTDKTDSFIQTALAKLDENYSECQADVIDASGGDVELTSTATVNDPKCLDGNTCFRLWIVLQASATTAYQVGGPERIAGCP